MKIIKFVSVCFTIFAIAFSSSCQTSQKAYEQNIEVMLTEEKIIKEEKETNANFLTETNDSYNDIPLIYDGAKKFSEGLAGVIVDGKVGYIDKNNNLVIPNEYELMRYSKLSVINNFTGSFVDGLVPVMKNNKVGYIDKDNKLVVPFIYDIGSDFSDGLALVYTEKDGYGYIDKNGAVVIKLEYDFAHNFSDGLASVRKEKDGYFGYIDKNGLEAIPFVYKNASNFSEGLAVVTLDGIKYKYINIKGHDEFTDSYNTAYSFKGEYAAVSDISEDRKIETYKIIDRTGKTISSTSNYWFCSVSENLVSSIFYDENDIDKSGYLDINLNEVIPFKYAVTSDFKDGFAYVVNNEQKMGVIDESGKIIVPMIYDFEYETSNAEISEGFINVSENGKFGFINLNKYN